MKFIEEEEKEQVLLDLICTLEENLRKGQYNDVDFPPFSIQLDRVKTLLQEWIRDGNLNRHYVPRPPIAEEKSNPRYCDYHRMVGHPLV